MSSQQPIKMPITGREDPGTLGEPPAGAGAVLPCLQWPRSGVDGRELAGLPRRRHG